MPSPLWSLLYSSIILYDIREQMIFSSVHVSKENLVEDVPVFSGDVITRTQKFTTASSYQYDANKDENIFVDSIDYENASKPNVQIGKPSKGTYVYNEIKYIYVCMYVYTYNGSLSEFFLHAYIPHYCMSGRILKYVHNRTHTVLMKYTTTRCTLKIINLKIK